MLECMLGFQRREDPFYIHNTILHDGPTISDRKFGACLKKREKKERCRKQAG
jgi:hypothetical protein